MNTGSSLLDRIPGDQLAAICRRFGIQELAVFGSVLRDDFSDNSDVDFLITYRPGHSRDFFEKLDLEKSLSNLIGRRVDVVPKDCLKPLLRKHVLPGARIIYEEG